MVLLDRDTLGLEFPKSCGRSNLLLREMGLFGTRGFIQRAMVASKLHHLIHHHGEKKEPLWLLQLGARNRCIRS